MIGAQRKARGFSLIEVMVAMVIVAFAAVGALGGMIAAQKTLALGAIRQVKMSLLEARSQKVLLANKTTLAGTAVAYTTAPAALAIGAAPWVVDNSTGTGDPGSGAYFKLLPDGSITPATGILAGTACSSTSIPTGTYCREMMTTIGTPTGAALGTGSTTVYTQWYRLSRVGEPLSQALILTEMFAP